MGKTAFDRAFEKGARAAADGRPRSACPYAHRRYGNAEQLAWNQRFRRAWFDGYDSGVAPAQPAPASSPAQRPAIEEDGWEAPWYFRDYHRDRPRSRRQEQAIREYDRMYIENLKLDSRRWQLYREGRRRRDRKYYQQKLADPEIAQAMKAKKREEGRRRRQDPEYKDKYNAYRREWRKRKRADDGSR